MTGIVFAAGSQFADVDLPLLLPFSRLTGLDLSNSKVCGTRINNGGLKVLSGLRNLATLNLRNARISDTGAKQLKELASLTTLDLANTEISDFALKELGHLKHLSALNLGNTAITDDGLRDIKALANLEYLNVRRTKVTRRSGGDRAESAESDRPADERTDRCQSPQRTTSD